MDLTHDDVEKILHIVDNAPHIDEIEFAHGGLHFRVCRGAVPGKTPQNRSSPPAGRSAPLGTEQSVTSRNGREQSRRNAEIIVRAPIAGIFRRSPAAGTRSLLEVGQKIHASDTVGSVGMANPVAVKAGVEGTVQQIFPEDGEFVEFDQILFVIGTAQRKYRP